MSEEIEPWEPSFPVRFYSGGDTTREAFGKHIQEILKIYGLLNALNSGKASSLELEKAIQEHKNDPNPHPNWKPLLNFSDLSGTIDALKVIGTLVNAYIAANHVTGLEAFIKSVMSADISKLQDDINNSGQFEAPTISNNQGYIKLPNGMIMQWGIGDATAQHGARITFPLEFPTKCLSVTGCPYIGDGSTDGQDYYGDFHRFYINMWDKTGFSYVSSDDGVFTHVSYQAIGH